MAPGQRILDVGSGAGSFAGYPVRCAVVAFDEDQDAFRSAPESQPGSHCRVFGKSHLMPFAAAAFDLVICHHVLEHVAGLEETLREIRRVLKPDGRFYAAVPDGYGLCDGIYRYVFEGGGHVNRFRREQLAELIEGALGLRLTGWQKIYSSFAYLWRLGELMQAPPPGLPKRMLRIGRLPRPAIRLLQRAIYVAARRCDRMFGTHLAVYGWALYFERRGGEARESPGYVNVCLSCGCGDPAASLDRVGRRRYRCANCDRVNPYFRPYGHTL